MATIITHAIAAATLGKLYAPPDARIPPRFWLLSMACAVLPDADVVAFAFNIKYGDAFGHRGFSHSLVFAFLLSCLVVASAFRNGAAMQEDGQKDRQEDGQENRQENGREDGRQDRRMRRRRTLVLYFFIVTASHGLLDALTNGGLGVAFFAPFDNERYFFPWTPLEVSPIGVSVALLDRFRVVLANELLWVWLPAFVLLLVVRAARGVRGSHDAK